MQTLTAQFISGKLALLRYDIDVPFEAGKVKEDFRLKTGLETLKLCLANARQVILMGHIGRPDGVEDPNLSVAPIYDWLEENGFKSDLESEKLRLLENLRFEKGEEAGDLNYAKELANLGEVYINEAFAAYRPASSTTILPTLLPSVAGLNFAREVEVLTKVRENPKKPLIAILGGAKIEEKLPVVQAMSKIADMVLVGGKLPHEIVEKGVRVPLNVFVAEMNQQSSDIAPQTTQNWQKMIQRAGMVMWNGPLGKVEDYQNNQTQKIAQAIIDSGAESIVGGGDTITALSRWGFLDKFTFVSSGGGAMLEFLATGSLPTIKALDAAS